MTQVKKAAKRYSVNQEVLDYSLGEMFDLVLRLGSDTLIRKVAEQSKERLATAQLDNSEKPK